MKSKDEHVAEATAALHPPPARVPLSGWLAYVSAATIELMAAVTAGDPEHEPGEREIVLAKIAALRVVADDALNDLCRPGREEEVPR